MGTCFFWRAHDSTQGEMKMKLVHTALLVAGLVALSACGGSEQANVAADNTAEDTLNVAADDLGAENLSGNELGGEATDLNAVDANAVDANAATENASGNAQ
jgi:hypothetical protein